MLSADLLHFVSDEIEKLGAASADEQRRKRHAYYIANRQKLLTRGRAYRVQKRPELKRKKKIYNRLVNSGGRRQRRRINTGSFSYGYSGYK